MIIALPKGVALKHSLTIVRHVLGEEPEPGRLQFCAPGGIKIVLVKHRDIPELISNDLVDVGVTSTDWLMEKGTQAHAYLKLDWCFTRISLLSTARDDFSLEEPLLCATEFPRISKLYIEARNLRPTFRLLHISGSTEAYVGTLCHVAIDCVETGETVRKNGLIERETIKEICTIAVTSNRGRRFTNVFRDMILASGLSAPSWNESY